MRKYDSRNKISIGVIIGICLVFAIIFSYFLIKEIKLSKISYELSSSSILFDIDKNVILLNQTGTVKKKWNNNYYLDYNNEKYQIGNHVISFNNTNSSLSLYGTFYEVNKNSEVNITKEETKLNNLSISRFYKVSDRKYLIIDPDISTSDKSLNTKNYLIVELDKSGNALLYNNNLNVKTFRETKLITSTYTFDIANELLIYENTTVDLKKILGTTNEYKDKNNGNESSTNNADNNTDNNGNNNENQQNTNNNGIVTNEPNNGESQTKDEIINETAVTSIIRIIPEIDSISVDYVIYDNMNKYLSSFVEVWDGVNNRVVYLSKNTTNVIINDLNPGTSYKLTFKYTHISDGIVKEEVIDTQNITTLLPNISLIATKITSKKIDYKIVIDSYNISSAKLVMYVDGIKMDNELNINSSNLQGEFNINNTTILDNSLVELKLCDIYIDGIKIDKVINWAYKKSVFNNSTNEGEE